jgi:DNA-directed RNA polymerase subunit RPC12/RpoP
MPRLKVKCRKCGEEYHLNSTDNMNCRKCDNGLLVRVDSHFERRIAKAKKDYISDIVDYSYSKSKD